MKKTSKTNLPSPLAGEGSGVRVRGGAHLLEVKTAASLLGIDERSVRRQCASGKLPAESVPSRGGKGGMKYLVPLSSLPPSAQAKYLNSEITQSDNLPVSSPLARARARGQGGEGLSGQLVPSPASGGGIKGGGCLPPWASTIALARADLLHAWHKSKPVGADRRVGPALEKFLAAYNTGQLFPAIFEALGEVSKGTLYRWERAYADADSDYRALAPEWGGSRGRTMVTGDVSGYLLGALLKDNQLSVNTAIKYTRAYFRGEGRTLPSNNTLRRYVDEFKCHFHHIWTLAREGEKALKDTDLPYIIRDWDKIEVGDMAVADGHKLNFRVQHPFTGSPCRAAMVMYFDGKSRFPLGWEIMPEEDVQAVASAFRMSVITLGKVPRVAYLDNGKAFKAKAFSSKVNLEEQGLQGMYARLGVIAIFAAPYNARAKIIERFFGTFSEWFERIMPSYTGASIEDKPAHHKRNEKLLQAVHKDYVPTIEEAMGLIARWLEEFYIHEPHSGLGGRTPAEVFEAGKGPGVNEAELDFLMLSMKVTRIERNGIRFERGYYWHEALVGWREPVIVRYSFNNYKRVLVHTLRGEFLCWAERQEKCNPLANVVGTVEDRAHLKHIQKTHKQVERNAKNLFKLVVNAEHLALPYGKLVELAPRLPEVIEQAAGERMAASACLPAPVSAEEGEAAFARLAVPAPRLYMHSYEKYDDLMKKQTITDEERRWMEEFEKTDEYRCSYAS